METKTPLTDELDNEVAPLADSIQANRAFRLCRQLEMELSAARRDAEELVGVLRECANAISSEFEAMGDDWKDQPIMRRKDKTLTKARAIIAKHAAAKGGQ